MDDKIDRGERILLIPLVSTLIFLAATILGYFYKFSRGQATEQYILYSFTIAIWIVSLYLMKNHNREVGLHLYLLVSFVSALYLNLILKNGLIILIMLNIYFILLSLFLLKKPAHLCFAFLFYLTSIVKIFLSNSDVKVSLIEALILTLLVIVIYEIKGWVMKLGEYKIQSVRESQNTTLHILAKVTELKDAETNNHVKRVGLLMGFLVEKLTNLSDFKKELKNIRKEDIQSASLLHDIGKIGVPDNILKKQGPLSEEEKKIMQSHTLIGYELIFEAKNEIGGQEIFDLALDITLHHHERWDGKGYPYRIKGNAIPLSARLMAIIDVYDALRSQRSYKPSFSHEKALNIMKKESGSHFDPVLLNVFFKHSREVEKLVSGLFQNQEEKKELIPSKESMVRSQSPSSPLRFNHTPINPAPEAPRASFVRLSPT